MRTTAPDVVALQTGYRQVTGAVSRLSPRGLLSPTLTDGWCVSDLLFHLLLDAQRALVTFATPSAAVPDVDTQRHVLTVADFVEALLVEATIHYLDLTAHLPAVAPADPAGLFVVRHTIEALLEAPLPSSWSDLKCALVGSGRQLMEARDQQELGDAAGRFPLIR